jgi:hypothetical protein
MSGIYWGSDDVRLVDYSALSRPKGTVITIKLETADPYALSSILASLGMFAAEQTEQAKQRGRQKAPTAARPPRQLDRQELLAIPHFSKGDDA